MYLNTKTGEVFRQPQTILFKKIQYPSTIFGTWSEAELNAIGIYSILHDDMPNRRYYTITENKHFDDLPPRVSYATTPVDIELLKTDMINKVIELAKEKLTTATSKYSPAEMAGWHVLEAEAREFLSSGKTGSMISMEAAMCGQEVKDLAEATIASAEALIGLRTLIVSTRYNKTKSINALATIDEVIAYENEERDINGTITTINNIYDGWVI